VASPRRRKPTSGEGESLSLRRIKKPLINILISGFL
jgi:hypothetical protein